MRRLVRTAAGIALAAVGWGAAGLGRPAEGAGVAIDAKEVELAEVLRLLAAQGGPAVVADPSVAKEKVSFAVKGVEAQAAVRWLCRVCRLAVVAGEGGRLTLGPPVLDKAITKEYSVGSVAATAAAAEGLASFVQRVILASYLNRGKAKNGELEPELEAAVEKGRLRVVAPPMVQREVVALLRALSPAPRVGSYKAVQVTYQPHELGMLNLRVPAAAPAIAKTGTTLDLADAPADEAAWALTSASNASFFVDPCDEELGKSKVTLKAEKMSLRVAVADVAKQLRAELVWFDGAYVFARSARSEWWEDFSVRVYNLEGRGGRASFALEEAERRAQGRGGPPGPWGPGRPGERPGERGGERSSGQLPYAVARVGDLALAALPQERQKDVESSLKAGPWGPPRPPSRK